MHRGDAPSQALERAVKGLAKVGTLAIIGVKPPSDRVFPIGAAMNKNLTVKMERREERSAQAAPLVTQAPRQTAPRGR